MNQNENKTFPEFVVPFLNIFVSRPLARCPWFVRTRFPPASGFYKNHVAALGTRPNSKIWIPDITGPPGVKTKLILDPGLVSEASWSTLGGGANKKIWFFGLEFYFFFTRLV